MFQNYFKQILQTKSRFASDVLRAQKSKALCGFSPKKNLDWIYMRWFHAMHCSVANRCYIRTNKRMQTWTIVSNRKNTHHRLHVGNTAQHSTSVQNWKKVAKRQSKRKLKIRLNLFQCRAKSEGNMGVEDKHCMIYGNTFHGTVAPAFKSQKGWEIWGKWLMGGQRHLLRHPWHPPDECRGGRDVPPSVASTVGDGKPERELPALPGEQNSHIFQQVALKKSILTQFGRPAFFIVLSVANWLSEFNQRASHTLVSTAGVKKSKPESVFKIAFRQFSTRGGFLFLNLILVIVRGNGER